MAKDLFFQKWWNFGKYGHTAELHVCCLPTKENVPLLLRREVCQLLNSRLSHIVPIIIIIVAYLYSICIVWLLYSDNDTFKGTIWSEIVVIR